MGSNSEDKSYVAGALEEVGKSDIERAGGMRSGGGCGGGSGSSRVARWA